MPNGFDDPFFPPPFFPPPFIPRGRDPSPPRRGRGFRGFRRGGERPDRGGLPNVIIPIPQPTQPVSRPIGFPTGPAANDPIFSRAGPFLRVGSIITGVAAIFDILIRAAQEKDINREQREREEADRQIARRLGADNPLRIIEFPEDFFEPRSPPIDEVPPLSRPELVTLPTPQVETVEIPEVPPVPVPVEVPTPGVISPTIPAPEVPPGPAPAPAPVPVPVGVPGIGSPTTPIFVPPSTAPLSFPFPSPVSFPLFEPIQFPRFDPIGDPLTPVVPPELISPLQPGSIELPEAQPQPQNRRCPAPKRRKKKRRARRDKCFKGLFREGPFDDQITFKKWVEIDCSSGRELGKRKRPTGPPELKIVERVKRVAKQVIGG